MNVNLRQLLAQQISSFSENLYVTTYTLVIDIQMTWFFVTIITIIDYPTYEYE